jgi:hypothetical protein
MPVIPEVQERLRNAVPAECDVPLVRASKEGLLLAADFFKDGMLLNFEMGRDLYGLIRRVCIAFQIREYCKRGDLPFKAQIVPMPKGPWHWLEIKAHGVLAHACRTVDVFSFPDEADSRQDYRLSIQPNLLSWAMRDKSMAQIVKEIPELYAWLTYRTSADGSLAHLCWCSPSPEKDDWLAHVNVLEEIKKSESDTSVAEASVPSATPRLRDEVLQALQANDNKKTDSK